MKFRRHEAYIREVGAILRTPALGITSAFGAVTGIVSAYDAVSSKFFAGIDSSYLLVALLIIWLIALSVALVVALILARRDRMTQNVTINTRGSIEVVSGDYVSTMKSIVKSMETNGESLDGLYCVIGISQKASMNSVSEGSALEAVLTYYIEASKAVYPDLSDEQIREQFQKNIDKSLALGGPKGEQYTQDANLEYALDYASCFVVDFDALEKNGACPKILFIVNSIAKTDNDCNNIEGPASIDVIPSIFQKTDDLNLSYLLMPALGTYRLGNSTQSVISSIIIRYITSITRRSTRTYNLIITLRKADLERSNIGLSQIKRYIRDTIALFS